MNAQIYLVTNKMNGKQYVGQTINPHLQRGHGRIMRSAYAKHGFDSFTYEPICRGIDNRNTLNCIERFWIKVMDTIVPNGYNIDMGGTEGSTWTEERRKQTSLARKGKKLNRPLGSKSGMKGKKYPEEGKRKLSEIMKGNKYALGVFPSEETRAKMSASQKAKAASFCVHPNAGKKASEETKEKMRQARARRIYKEEDKRKISEAVTAWHKKRKEKSWL